MGSTAPATSMTGRRSVPGSELRCARLASRERQHPNRGPEVRIAGARRGLQHRRGALVLRGRGLDVLGIEPNAAAAAAARAKGIEVLAAPIESAPLPEARFRSAILSQVLEHVRDPQAVLRRIRPSLAPEARAYVVVPNMRSIWRSGFGVDWVHWHVPFHFWHHTPSRFRSYSSRRASRSSHSARSHPASGSSCRSRLDAMLVAASSGWSRSAAVSGPGSHLPPWAASGMWPAAAMRSSQWHGLIARTRAGAAPAA